MLTLSTSAALADVTLPGDALSLLLTWMSPQTQHLAPIPDSVVTVVPSDQVSWSQLGVRATSDPGPIKISGQ